MSRRKYKWEIDGIEWRQGGGFYMSFAPLNLYSIERMGPRCWTPYHRHNGKWSALTGPSHSVAQAMQVCEIHLAQSEEYPW